jgi:uncharacterized membrane protein
MEKKVGWIFIIGGLLLFVINFVTFGNKEMFTASWADIVSGIIGFVVCPLVIFAGIIIFILGKKKN